MRELTVGKRRGLRQCSDRRGTLSLLALDHRNNLRKALRPEAPAEVADGELTAFKREAVAALAEAATAVLLDPEFGAAQMHRERQPCRAIAASSSPWRGRDTAADPHARESRILADWSVAKIRRMGASAAKLLVYYHPEASTARQIEQLVREVARRMRARGPPARARAAGRTTPIPRADKLSPESRRRAILETARRLVGPGRGRPQGGISGRLRGRGGVARRVSRSSPPRAAAPWILLSAAADFETFLRQTEAACRAGASGVAVGRAVWNEAARLAGAERAAFLTRTKRAGGWPRSPRCCAERARPVVGALLGSGDRRAVVLTLLTGRRRSR